MRSWGRPNVDRSITPAHLAAPILVDLHETPIGNDTWGVSMVRVVFYFSDGTRYTKTTREFFWLDEGKGSTKMVRIP